MWGTTSLILRLAIVKKMPILLFFGNAGMNYTNGRTIVSKTMEGNDWEVTWNASVEVSKQSNMTGPSINHVIGMSVISIYYDTVGSAVYQEGYNTWYAWQNTENYAWMEWIVY